MKKHANIPIFIPHLGCPNQCVFCNQHTISGVESFEPESVVDIIEEALATIGDKEAEIAFFGGSFTGIDRDLMIRLLEIANGYLTLGKVSAIRCSTRPDYIDDEILDILKKYGVKVIELGLQSTSPDVLLKTKRGHDFSAEERACRMIVESGFSLIGQMMIGLPASSMESEIETAKFIISSGAVGARIYPTVVFKETELCDMAITGKYKPLSLESAVSRSAAVMKLFIENGVEVIRVGLCSSDNLSGEDTYFAGPNHPAIGELVENELYYKLIYDELSSIKTENTNINVFVPRGALSKAIGQKKKNKLRLINDFKLSDIKFTEREDIPEYCVTIER